MSDAQTMSKEAAQQMYTELTRGQDITKPNVTPEMVAERLIGVGQPLSNVSGRKRYPNCKNAV